MSEEDQSWEVVKLPPELEIATKNRQSAPAKTQDTNEKDDQKERLCGYLFKLGAIGIRTWKKRWFVFEPRRCILYYYRTPDCTEPLGNIEIANATFSIATDLSIKGQFEIKSLERTYHLQAGNKETAQFWLQELKAERAKFMRLQSNMSSDSRLADSTMRPTSGLLSTANDGADEGEDSRDPIYFADPVKKPATVGEATRSESSQSLSNISFSNIKTEIKNLSRKSGIFTSVSTGESLRNETEDKSLPTINEKAALQKNVKLRETRASRSVDFGFMKMSAALKRRTFWGNQSFTIENDRETTEVCRDCEEVKGILFTLKEAIQIAEKEIKTRDEVIENLHEQIRFAVTNKPENNTRENKETESIEEKDNYIGQLTKIIRKLESENETLQIRLQDKDDQLKESSEKLDVLEELVRTKDSEIISLTNQIFTMERPETAEVAFEETSDINESELKPSPSLNEDQLKETCAAYKEQNKLLNSEILEVMEMRQDQRKIIEKKEARITELEAELCKIKSRYVLVLKELSVPVRGKERDQELIQHLLEDAINQETGKERPRAESRYVDRYGFYETVDIEDEDALLTYSEKLEEKSSGDMPNTYDMSAGVKWENLLVNQGSKPIQKSDEIKFLVRGGIPHEYRARVWRDIIMHYVRHSKQASGEGYFHSLLEDRRNSYTPAKKQIELDLLRTLPNNKFYDRVDSEGTCKLRNVLLAYSWHNSNVGYCQGLNRLGAIALLYLEEEDAFWCLVAITENLLPSQYYNESLIDAQVDQRVFKELFEEKLPKLSQLFQNLYVDLSLLTFNWFLAVFVDVFPVELTLRIWDTFLYEGNKIRFDVLNAKEFFVEPMNFQYRELKHFRKHVLFRYSLAIFKSCEEDLLKLKDSGAVYKYFRRIPSHRMNPHRISQIAFQQMNPFPKKNIVTKRNQHKPKLQAELREFEELRRDKSGKESEHGVIFSDGDDED